MHLANHHSHTHYSDGQLSPKDYLEEAIKQGLKVYGFSDHAPVPLEGVGLMTMDQLQDYLQEVEDLKNYYKGKIEIYKALEVDYIPGLISMASDHVVQAELDYMIGAVHYVGQFPDGQYWGFEESQEHFEKGINDIFEGEVEAAIRAYYQLIREMVQHHRPEIIAHLDRIKKWNNGNRYFSEDSSWYRYEVIRTLEVIAACDTIMEINTKGYYRKETAEPYPGKWILTKAQEMGIPVHLSSDAHHPSDITKGFDYGLDLLHELGYSSCQVLLKGTWQPMALGKKSIYSY